MGKKYYPPEFVDLGEEAPKFTSAISNWDQGAVTIVKAALMEAEVHINYSRLFARGTSDNPQPFKAGDDLIQEDILFVEDIFEIVPLHQIVQLQEYLEPSFGASSNFTSLDKVYKGPKKKAPSLEELDGGPSDDFED